MNDLTQQYYIVRRAKGENVPILGTDEVTMQRNFSFERQPVGATPIVFRNHDRQNNLASGLKEFVAPILFHANNLVVRTSIRESLLDLDIPGMYMHPSIYIDDLDNWHEDYWYLTFTELFDCWDRTLSETSESWVGSEDNKRYDVYDYVLDKDVMDRTPLEKRLLFKMGGAVDAPLFCHESIVGLFRREMPNGARFVLATD